MTATFLLGHLASLVFPTHFETWNSRLTDQLFLLRDRLERFQPAYDGSIVHVDLDDTSLQILGELYLSRSHFARVARNLAAMRVRAQVYDFIFAAPLGAEDADLIEAARLAGNVYFGLAFRSLRGTGEEPDPVPVDPQARAPLERAAWRVVVDGDPRAVEEGHRPLVTFEALAAVSRGAGFLNLQPDPDGIVRRVPLLIRQGPDYYPSLPLRVACDHLQVSPEDVVLRPGHSLTLSLPPGRGVPEGRLLLIPLDGENRMLVNFLGPWGRMKHYRFARVWAGAEDPDELDFWREELEGKLVIVSDTTTGTSDLGAVPTDPEFPRSGVHSHALHTILTGGFLRALSPRESLLLELPLLGALILVSLPRSSLLLLAGGAGAGIVWLGLWAGAFFYGSLILNVVRPVLFVATAAGAVASYRYFREERERLVLRRSFEAYFPPSVVRRIVHRPEAITSGGRKKELTVLFSDIKGFTGYCANRQPEQIQGLLNEYFEAMTEIVFEHGGTLDKFIGDGLLVFFGDPEPLEDHALKGVQAALEMQRKARELKARWEARGDLPLEIRIGINTGPVIVGNMGSPRRLAYTVLGAEVNLAQRLEAGAPAGGILISRKTYEKVKDFVPTRAKGQIQVKGLDDPVAVYEVLVNASRVPRSQGCLRELGH